MKANGHATHRLIISTVFLGVLALGIAGCDDRMARMEENQIRLQAMVAANARQLATVSSQVHVNNDEVQAGIQKLDRNDRDLAAGVSTVRNEQSALHETVRSANQAMDKRMATLDENQRLLQDGVSQVAGVAQRTASDVTAIAKQHATLHQMVQTGRRELGESIASVAVTGEKIRTDIGQLQQIDQRMAEQLVALAAGQDRIYNGLDGLNTFMQAVARDVTGLSQGQAALGQSLREHGAALADKSAILEGNQRNIQAAVAGVAAGQTAVQQTLGANHKIVAGQIAAVIENQQGLQAGISGLSEQAGQTAAQLTTLAAGQDAIRETLSNGNGVVAARLAGLSENQTGLQNNLSGLHRKADTIVSNVTTVQAQQTSLHETLKTNHEAVQGQVAQLSGEQQQLQGRLDVLTATAGQTALDVVALNDSGAILQRTLQTGMNGLGEKADRIAAGLTGVTDRQTAVQQHIAAGNKALADQASAIAATQASLQAQLDTLLATASQTAVDLVALSESEAGREQAAQAGMTRLAERTDKIGTDLRGNLDTVLATTDRTARDVTAAAARQEAMQQALQAHTETVTRGIAGLAENDKQIQSGVDLVTATSGQTALDVIAMASQQESMQQTLQNHGKTMNGRMVELASGQEQVRNGLDAVTATTGQTALDVIAVASRQEAVQQALHKRDKVVDDRMVQLANGQNQMRDGLDAVTAVTGQTALDVLSLSEGQVKLAQAVKADRQEVITRLAELVQSQQQWVQRFDAAQANVQTIAANITTLERHLTKLQGSLQPSLDGLASQLGANGQGQARFETKVNQDIQVIVEAVAQLRRDQASLTEQMQQIQERVLHQTKDILTALQQLRQPPAEVKVSDSGTKLESSVAEAAAK